MFPPGIHPAGVKPDAVWIRNCFHFSKGRMELLKWGVLCCKPQVDLSWNPLTAASARALLRLVRQNTTLRHINLAGTKVCLPGNFLVSLRRMFASSSF